MSTSATIIRQSLDQGNPILVQRRSDGQVMTAQHYHNAGSSQETNMATFGLASQPVDSGRAVCTWIDQSGHKQSGLVYISDLDVLP